MFFFVEDIKKMAIFILVSTGTTAVLRNVRRQTAVRLVGMNLSQLPSAAVWHQS